MDRPVRILGLVLALAGLALAPRAATAGEQAAPPRQGPSWEELRSALELALDAAEAAPEQVRTLIQEELQRIGRWEYRILSIRPGLDADVEARLNALGRDRWEAFWMERDSEGLRVYLKRPSPSWLKVLPALELWRRVPAGRGHDEPPR